MKSLGVLAVICLAGCGDNSNQCGPGTTENNGVCEPVGDGLICSDGTVLDELTNECVPDPSVCGGGTVLINGSCQDPTAGLTIDLLEGPEPNGFELDATPAGLIELPDIGEPFVLKGCVAPTGVNAPDLDVFQLDVTGPTLLHVSADGVEGLAAGFLVLGQDPRLGSWQRLGINVTTDTSKRELFLPVAGRYALVMTDTRTLLPITQNGEGFPAAGNPDGTSCYFVTINQRAIPSSAALSLASATTGTIGEELKFFTAPFPTGFTTMIAVIDPEDVDGDGTPDFDTLGNLIDSRAAASIVLMNPALRQINDADASSPVTDAIFGGIKAGDSPLLVLDYVWNYAVGPADFRIEVIDQTDSQGLSTTGGAIDATSNGQFFADDDNNTFFENVNLFHFDVTAAGEVDLMDLAFSIPVQGSIVDQDGFFASPLTGLNTNPDVVTFTGYEGLFRAFDPGRYYFVVFAPTVPVDTAFTVTSTITPLTPTLVATGTPTTPVAFNSVRSNAFRYAGGAEPWHTFNAAGDASVGDLSVQLYDPTVTIPQTPGFAFGRLDTMLVSTNGSPPLPDDGDATPLVAPAFPVDGSAPIHTILRNPFAALPPDPTEFLIKVNPTIANPTGTFSLDFSARVYDDFNGPAIAAGQTRTANRTMTAGSEERFYFETTPGNRYTIQVAPVGSQPDLDLVVELLARDESVIDAVVTAGGGEVTIDRFQNLSGVTAFRVLGTDPTSAGNYTVEVSVIADDYTAAQAPALFLDACVGGSVVALTSDVSGFDPDDEGLSQPIAAPNGFTLHGEPVTNFLISSNGFLSFDTTLDEALFENTPFLATNGVSIAPHWDDLFLVTVCTKSTSSRRVVQWDGVDIDNFQRVQFQAEIDSTGAIIFRYGPQHDATGSTATIGVHRGGEDSLELGFQVPVEVADSSIVLTPN